MPTKKTRYTVYPDNWALEIIGTHTGQLNLALECWAQATTIAEMELEELLTDEEWKEVRKVAHDAYIDPVLSSPGLVLATMLRGELAKKVEEMDYVHAWALLLAARRPPAKAKRR